MGEKCISCSLCFRTCSVERNVVVGFGGDFDFVLSRLALKAPTEKSDSRHLLRRIKLVYACAVGVVGVRASIRRLRASTIRHFTAL